MTLLKVILLTVAFPAGLLFCVAYAIDEIRLAVCDYVPEALFPPIGLICFFAFGACVGTFAALLAVPEAILDQRGNREELRRALGVPGTVGVRVFCAASLAAFLYAASIIYEKAYG